MKNIRLSKRSIIIILITLGNFIIPSIILAQGPDTPAPDFFIEAEVNNPAPYLGQQIIYTLNRYQAIAFSRPPYYEDHPFIGVWHTFLIQRPPYMTTIAGREYRVHQTHIALFPTRPGPITLDPARLVIPSDGPEADIILESRPISLMVRPLPSDSPPTFRGAVGQFEIEARLSALEGKVDQAMSLIVEVTGAGNIETLVEPILPVLPKWRLLESEVTTDIPLSKEVVKGTRQFIWAVVPKEAGEQQIPPIDFSYYDPQDNAYHTIHTGSILAVILPAETGPAASGPPIKQEIIRLGGDIRHIKPAPASLDIPSLSSQAYLTGYLICSILPLLIIAAAWGWQRRRHYWLADTPEARRRRAAYKAKRMLALAQHPHIDPMVLIRQTLLEYLADKLDRPIAGLTSNQLIDLLKAARLDPDLIRRTQTLLGQVESSRFAPVAIDQVSTQALLASAHSLIIDLENSFHA